MLVIEQSFKPFNGSANWMILLVKLIIDEQN